ncbi:MAG TPA: TonB-dependent receptor [Vicinamibacterales bacterium]|nr:TonB-dependent receptor [Vicinamibacterales bacterium]
MPSVVTVTLALLLSAAQAAGDLRGSLVDFSGAAVPDATVTLIVDGRETPVPVGNDGTFVIPPGGGVLRVRAGGFEPAEITVAASARGPLRIVLHPASFASSIVVTADRGATRLPSAASATVLSSAELVNSAAGALDDVLRVTPGFTLFRRSSSRTANPTTQGVTLRGVSGSGASRTLVLADGVPLNDPFGSWVYWNRVPLAAIDRVEIVRGGSGDLYGADALGGVIQVLTFTPGRPRMRAVVDGGSHQTGRGSVFGGTTFGAWTATAAGEWVGTDGAPTLDPAVAGPVDLRADSDYKTGFASFGTQRNAWRASARLSGYSEDRNNGTPVQVNNTDWRQLSGELAGVIGMSAWDVHVAGGSQDYYQTFSAVAGDRRTERLTTEQTTPTEFVSVSGQWSRPLGRHSVMVGAEGHQTDSTVEEFRYTLVAGQNLRSGPFLVGGKERGAAVYGRMGLALGDRMTVSLGLRGDTWRSEPLLATLQPKSLTFVSPRVGVGYRLGNVTLQAAAYRAHRTPTLNELHRGFRVGAIVTNPNVLLEAEELTGVEGGALFSRGGVSLRVTGFANTLEGAIANVTVAPNVRIRQNSDEIRATGAEVEADIRLHRMVTLTAQTTLTSSHFRGSIATPALEGNRVPQVPRAQYGAGLTVTPPWFTAALQTRGSGNQYDDDTNSAAFELKPYAIVDVSVSRQIARVLQGFVSVENVFDEDYDTGRTPLRTIGWPRTVRAGVRIALP